MPQTYSWNAFEATLASGISAVSDDITLDSTLGLREPGYLVLEPESPTKREYFKFTGISGATLTGCTPFRGLSGSANSAQAHDAGVKVRAVAMHQMFDDLWVDVIQNASDIGDGDAALATHIANPSDPHAAAGYLTEADADPLYVDVEGDTMTGPLVLPGDPTADLEAATKQYVDTYDTDTSKFLDVGDSPYTLLDTDELLYVNAAAGDVTIDLTSVSVGKDLQRILIQSGGSSLGGDVLIVTFGGTQGIGYGENICIGVQLLDQGAYWSGYKSTDLSRWQEVGTGGTISRTPL